MIKLKKVVELAVIAANQEAKPSEEFAGLLLQLDLLRHTGVDCVKLGHIKFPDLQVQVVEFAGVLRVQVL